MTEIEEIQTALGELHALAGPKSWVDLSIKPRSVDGVIYPEGVCSRRNGELSERIGVSNPDWRIVISELRSEFERRVDQRKKRVTEEMALAIIHLTYQHGECTDAQLRGADFDAVDVALFGQAACERANEMTNKGPFVLTIQEAANDVEAAS